MPFQVTVAVLGEIMAAEFLNISDCLLDKTVLGITTDTRSLQAGEVFLALQGENFDGHQFVETAMSQGAIAAIVGADSELVRKSKTESHATNFPLLLVRDTLQAYQQIATWWRQQFQIPIVTITGSVGKTTTKELIAAVLATQGKVLKTQANYNNEIGVPKTLLELDYGHAYAVVEMGMRGRGEIALLSQIACPTVGVITNVGTAHIGRLGSREAIAQAKCELLAEMPATSIAILNHDNHRLIETAATVWQGSLLTYGLDGGNVRGELLDVNTLLVVDAGKRYEFPLPLPGRHNALNFLAALAVAKVLGIDWDALTGDLSLDLPTGRAQRYELSNGITILDESYNAGPESMVAALELLAQTPAKRRIAVLGTMKELGARSQALHRQVGERIQQLGLDRLFVLADPIEAEALTAGATPIPTEQFSTHATLIERLEELLQPEDCLLVKASHSVQLNRIVEHFRGKDSAE